MTGATPPPADWSCRSAAHKTFKEHAIEDGILHATCLAKLSQQSNAYAGHAAAEPIEDRSCRSAADTEDACSACTVLTDDNVHAEFLASLRQPRHADVCHVVAEPAASCCYGSNAMCYIGLLHALQLHPMHRHQ